jgi:hypothetical protein
MDIQSSHIKRLAFIKYLYTLGVLQSYQPEPVNATSILIFHDAVELFNQLSSEVINVGKEWIGFMEYWDLIGPTLPSRSLPQQESMRRLNKTRVSLKHHGTLPSTMDIEHFRHVVKIFFEESTPIIYGRDFDDISLIDIIEFESVSSHLKQGASYLGQGKIFESVVEIAIAFRELIRSYEEHMRTMYGISPFYFRTRNPFLTSRRLGFRQGKGPLLGGPDVQRYFEEYIEWVNESIDRVQDIVRILALGIDYPQYVWFRHFTPRVHQTSSGEYETSDQNTSTTPDQAQFCLDFVIETAFKIQQLRYSLKPPRDLTV